MTDEPQYDDTELAEAEALARALERGHTPPSKVDDAVDAADVVRMLKAPVLGEDRLEATLADSEQRIAAARRRSRTRIFVLGAAGSALAIAAAALLFVLPARHSEPSAAAIPVPTPSAQAPRAEEPAAAPVLGAGPIGTAQALRQAQIAWLEAPSTESRGTLDHMLATFRDEQLAMIERKYGGYEP